MKFRRNQLEYRFIKVAADAAAADATAATPFGRIHQDVELKRLELLPLNTLTAHDTNYATITVKAGTTTIWTFTTKITGGSGDWVSGTPITATIAAANIRQAGGTSPVQLTVEIAKAAAGVVVPICMVQLQAMSDKELY
jgi:hypothetical protein